MRILKSFGIILVFTTFTINCGQADKTKNEAKQKNEIKRVEKKKDKKADDAVPVQIVMPKRGDISSFLLFSSNIDTEKAADIYPMTTGIIKRILFEEGDEVKKDAILAELDDREASINEQKAHIKFKQLKSEFERKSDLFEKQLISKETFDKARFDMEQAELDWKQNKLILSYTKITTPISGVVAKRLIKTGNKITTTQLAFSVIYTKEKIAVVNIPEQEKSQIFKKQKVVITADNLSLKGEIKSISPSIDPESGTFKVRVLVKDKKSKLSVGQFVNVKIVKKIHSNVILATKEALIYEGGKVFVFIVDKESIARKRIVKIGFDDGLKVEVISGIKENDKLVTAGKSSLKDKTKVKIIKSVL